jgi:LmbE family N-acetylglucosaminyl deacetylase
MADGFPLSGLAFAHARKILVVAPHPDDETLGCGGLISLLAQNGSAFYIVFVTDGSASHRNSRAWPSARLAHNANGKPAMLLHVSEYQMRHCCFSDCPTPICPLPKLPLGKTP